MYGGFEEIRNTTPGFLAEAASSIFVALGFVILYYRLNWHQFAAVRRFTFIQLLLVLLTVAPVAWLDALGLGLLEQFYTWTGWEEIIEGSGAALILADGGFWQDLEERQRALAEQSWPVLIFVGCIAPAVSEELIFRGFLGRGLVARHGVVLGIILTSIFFGLVHLQPMSVVSAFAMGLILHLEYLAARSIFVPMLHHGLHNFLVFGYMKLKDATLLEEGPLDEYVSVSAALTLLACCALPLLVFLWVRTRTRWLYPGMQPWTPGYPTAEAPPTGSGCKPVSGRAGWLPSLGVLATGALFVALLAGSLVSWSSGLGPTTAYWDGEDLFEEARWDDAIAAYTVAIERDPNYAMAYCRRGECRLRKRDQILALNDFDAAIRADPFLADAHYFRGWCCLEAQDNDSAVASLTRALELGADWGNAWGYRATAYENLGQHRLALADYERAIQDRAEQPWLRMHAAWLYATSPKAIARDGKKAVEHGQKLLELMGDDRYALNIAAAAYAESGDFEEAIRLQEMVLARSTIDERPGYERTMALYKNGQPYRTELKQPE
jgi:membrane protease YdiL (CAAX protease family)/Flp pilus assembly protein TadD